MKKEAFPTRVSLAMYFMRGSWRYFLFSFIFACLVAVLDLANPKLIGYTVDSVIGHGSAELPGPLLLCVNALGGPDFLRAHPAAIAGIVIAVAFAAAVSRYLFRLLNSFGGENLVCRIRDTLFDHILRLPDAWHRENQTGDIIQRCTSDVETIKSFLSERLTSLLRIMLLIGLAVYFMCGISVKMTVVAGAFIPIIIGYSFFFHNKIGSAFEECDEQEGVLSTIAQENLTGVRIVRAFGREIYERERFEKQNEHYTGLWVRLMMWLSAFWSTGDLISGLQILCVTVFGAVLCVKGEITTGGYIAFCSYNAMLTWPVRAVGRVIADMSRAEIAIDRIRYIMNSPVEEDRPGALEPPMDRDVVFEHVTFAPRDGRKVLDDVSFTIPAGTTVGVLGGTGSGKTTLACLLDRLYELPEGCGRITVGGVDIADMKASWVRKNVGLVLQEPFLFSRTIEENIGIARPTGGLESKITSGKDSDGHGTSGDGTSGKGACGDSTSGKNTSGDGTSSKDTYSDGTSGKSTSGDDPDGKYAIQRLSLKANSGGIGEDIRKAAAAACLDETIEGFASGYETFVGERGVTLSGGQKQRTAIAQMLVKKPKIMVFDDSLSAVDAETDAKIRRQLEEQSAGTTVMLIAHRISTLMKADNIIVLDKGRIIESGTHEELVAKGGVYKKVYDLQTRQQE